MIDKALTYLFTDYNRQANAKLFKNLLYAFILLKCLLWISNFSILFGDHALSCQAAHSGNGFRQFAFLVYFSNSPAMAVSFIAVAVIFAGFSLINKRSFLIIDLCLYFIIININAKTYTSLTAGDPLLANLCFIGSFLRKDFSKRSSFLGDLSVVLHNFSMLALITQVCIIYAYSALAKWFDADWLSGNAVHLVNMTWHYSRAVIVDHAQALYPLSVVLSYLILLYQSVFPALIWFKKIKKYFLHVGVFMHLYIALVMGLFFFGLIMAITYSLFYDLSADRKLSSR